MSPDDINDLVYDLHEFMLDSMGVLFDDDEYDMLYNFMQNKLDPFVTKERNHN